MPDQLDFPRHPAKRSQLVMIILAVLTIPFGVGVIFLAIVLYRYYVDLYSFDGEFVRNNTGIISRDMQSVRIGDLRQIGLNQGIVGRILGYGTLSFSTAGTEGAEVVWKNIRSPSVYHAHFEDLIRS